MEKHEEEEDTALWLLLPVELVLELFRWLDPEALLQVEGVCRQWRAVTGPGSPHGTSLWRAVLLSLSVCVCVSVSTV
jgi:hypothetical protein